MRSANLEGDESEASSSRNHTVAGMVHILGRWPCMNILVSSPRTNFEHLRRYRQGSDRVTSLTCRVGVRPATASVQGMQYMSRGYHTSSGITAHRGGLVSLELLHHSLIVLICVPREDVTMSLTV